MEVLITGGAGFIGSHLVDYHLSNGDRVTVLDNLSTGSASNLNHCKDKITFVNGDIRDSELVGKLIGKSDLILHMAAALGVKNILKSPIESISTNFLGSEIVMHAALKHNKRILLASTSEIYGKNPKQPLSESDDRLIGAPQKIRWTYSDAKALEEAVAHFLFLESGLKVTTVRFFNTVGPRQTGQYGMVVPRFVKAAIKDEPIEIYGTGTQTRVFCHVSDAIEAVSNLLQIEDSIGDVFNIGGEGEVSINELAIKIKEQTFSNSSITHLSYSDAYPVGFEDMQRRVPDITKISSLINWKPSRNLTKIIEDVAKDIKSSTTD